MKMKYMKPESTVIEVQSDNCMQHFTGVQLTNPDGSSEDFDTKDGVPDDDGWNTAPTGLRW